MTGTSLINTFSALNLILEKSGGRRKGWGAETGGCRRRRRPTACSRNWKPGSKRMEDVGGCNEAVVDDAVVAFRSGMELGVGASSAADLTCAAATGAGKSSVREAISLDAPRGGSSRRTKKGLGWEDLAAGWADGGPRRGGDRGIGPVARTYQNGTRNLTLAGRQNEIAANQRALCELLNVTRSSWMPVSENSSLRGAPPRATRRPSFWGSRTRGSPQRARN